MLIIFDLDGTLAPDRLDSIDPFERFLFPGVEQACHDLRKQGHVLAIATNQGGAIKNRPGRLTIAKVHNHLRWVCRTLGITTYRFAVVPPRKKPSPAMLLELMDEFGFGPESTIFVGDSHFDKGAAEAAGCQFIPAEEFFGPGTEASE